MAKRKPTGFTIHIHNICNGPDKFCQEDSGQRFHQGHFWSIVQGKKKHTENKNRGEFCKTHIEYHHWQNHFLLQKNKKKIIIKAEEKAEIL